MVVRTISSPDFEGPNVYNSFARLSRCLYYFPHIHILIILLIYIYIHIPRLWIDGYALHPVIQ